VLRSAQSEINKIEFEAWRKSLFKRKEDYKDLEEKAVSFHVILLACNFQTGTYESIQFTNMLCEKGEELNELFNSTVVRQLLEYKMGKVKGVGYVLIFNYFLYLGFVTFYPHRWTMLFWMIYFILLEVKQIYGLSQFTGFKETVKDYVSFWNMLD
jgi:hypothetical protein